MRCAKWHCRLSLTLPLFPCLSCLLSPSLSDPAFPPLCHFASSPKEAFLERMQGDHCHGTCHRPLGPHFGRAHQRPRLVYRPAIDEDAEAGALLRSGEAHGLSLSSILHRLRRGPGLVLMAGPGLFDARRQPGCLRGGNRMCKLTLQSFNVHGANRTHGTGGVHCCMHGQCGPPPFTHVLVERSCS
jgi:hypothetical protein